AHKRTLQIMADKHATHVTARTAGGGERQGFPRALPIASIRMTGKCGLPPAAAGEIIWIGGIALQNCQFLPTDAFDCISVEARARERETQQAESFVAIFVHHSQRAVEIVAAYLETEFDGVVFKPLMEDLPVEVAGALVEQIRGQMAGASLVRLILASATQECIVERDQRHGFFTDQPGLDTGGAYDFFNRHRRG